MKPEMSPEAVLDGKPSLTRVKRLARFATQAVKTLPKPAEAIGQMEDEKNNDARKLENRGRNFLNALRENFGESLKRGLIVRPHTDGPHEIIVEAMANDTQKSHQTAATVQIISGEGNATRFIVGAIEPTVASHRLKTDAVRRAWIKVLDPADDQRLYDPADFNPSERQGMTQTASHIFGEVERACDRGDCTVYTQVGD